ncbi:hypothetical protein SAMN05444487_10560 [Marininema mesophilum]|uniref:ABC-2 type transport system permease protein n=1 Tax=Marininema mesophilum TaxID=1048340 RepID=A0A1H2VCM1_9BACL|nr:hypothetical protein [Marininema mesophilum]SDW65980.1 hypothetical protein SAMN05444487_10560 [Marininema mesophilum]
MKKGWALFELIVRGQFRLSYFRDRYQKKSRRWEIGVGLLGLVLLEWFILNLYGGAYHLFDQIGQPEKVFQLLVIGGVLWVLVTSITHLIQQLYFTQDAEVVSPLPLTPNQVVGARLAGVWLGQVVGMVIFFLPGFYLYGLNIGMGPSYYILVLDLLLALPVLPIVFTGSLVLGLMRAIPWGKYHHQLRRLGPIFIALLYVVMFVLIQWVNGGRGTFLAQGMLDVPGTIASYFYPLHWALGVGSSGISGWINALFFDSFSLCLALLFIIIGGSLYQKGLHKISMDGKRTGKPGKVESNLKERSPFRVLLRREYHLLMDTPVFVTNVIFQFVIVPLVFLVGNLSEGGIDDLSIPPIFLHLGGVVMILVMGAMNDGEARSALSREGRFFYLSKVIPVPWRIQIGAKYTFAMMILLCACVTISLLQVLFFGTWMISLWTFITGALVGSLFVQVGLLIDLRMPNLTWQTPREALQGLGRLWMYLLLAGFVGFVGPLTGFLVEEVDLPFIQMQLIWSALFIGLNVASWKWLVKVANRRYQEIDG